MDASKARSETTQHISTALVRLGKNDLEGAEEQLEKALVLVRALQQYRRRKRNETYIGDNNN